jgi:hypothetical protein
MKKNIKYIRDDFKRRFEELSKQEHLEISNECPWPYNLSLEDNYIVRWLSENLARSMTMQETGENETLRFDYVIDKVGVDLEYDDLFVMTKNTNEKAETIFEIYKLWFVENKSPEEMGETLETYFKGFNPDYNIDEFLT